MWIALYEPVKVLAAFKDPHDGAFIIGDGTDSSTTLEHGSYLDPNLPPSGAHVEETPLIPAVTPPTRTILYGLYSPRIRPQLKKCAAVVLSLDCLTSLRAILSC